MNVRVIVYEKDPDDDTVQVVQDITEVEITDEMTSVGSYCEVMNVLSKAVESLLDRDYGVDQIVVTRE